MTLNYIEHFLTLVFAVTVCIFISAFGSLVDISKGIKSPTTELNICAIIGRIKKYKSIIKKKKKKHEEITLSGNIWAEKYRKKIWAHRFLAKPKTAKNDCSWGRGVQGDTLPCPLVFCIKHAKTVIVRVNIGSKIPTIILL